MSAYFRTYEIDRGHKAIGAQLMSLDGAKTEAGLPADGKTAGRYGMEDLARIAAINEFEIPSGRGRPFMRDAADENREAIFAYSASALDRIFMRLANVRTAISGLGDRMVGFIKQKIQDGDFEPLASSTVAKKGHDMPLVETGQLYQSIQHRDTVKGTSSFSPVAGEVMGAAK